MDLDLWVEKRQHPRASFNWPVTLISSQGTTALGKVRDISRGGVLVHVETLLQINEQVRLAIEIPNFNDVISATGEIVRTLLLEEQSSPFTYGLSIRFTKISEEDCRYFTGNLATEWQEGSVAKNVRPERREGPAAKNVRPERREGPAAKNVRPERREGPAAKNVRPERQEIENKVNNTATTVKRSLRWVIGLNVIGGLVLAAIVFFEFSLPMSPEATDKEVLQEEIHRLSEYTGEEFESLQQSHRQQAASTKQIKKNLLYLEKNIIPAGQIEEIRSSLKFLSQQLEQIKIDITKQKAAQKEISTIASPDKTAKAKESSAYYIVRQGDTLYSISKRYGFTVEKLRELNDLGNRTAIHLNQKLRIQPHPSTIQAN